MTDEINTNANEPLISDEFQKEIKIRFELLPPDVQKVVTDSNYTKDLFEIAKANKLTYEHLETLQTETFMALLGMNNPEEYRTVLQGELKKSDAEMDILISAINERIFDPIKESLKKVYNNEDVNEEEVVPDENEEVPVSGVEAPANYFAGNMNTAPLVNSGQATPPENLPIANVISIRTAPISQPIQATPIQQAFVPASSPSGLSSTEESVLGKAGVVLGESQNNAGMSQQAEPAMSSRNDLMKGIENPTRTPTSTIMANKLSTSATLMPNKTTDYSLPRTTPQSTTPASTPASVSTQSSGDKYREAV